MKDGDQTLDEVLRGRRRRRRAWRQAAVAACVIAALLVLAYAAADHGLDAVDTTPPTGVQGTVMRVPIEVAARRPTGSGAAASAAPDNAAGATTGAAGGAASGSPLAALVQISDLKGKRLGAVMSGLDGRFAAEIPPGRYVLTAVSPIGTALPVSLGVRVTVREGQMTWAELTLPASDALPPPSTLPGAP